MSRIKSFDPSSNKKTFDIWLFILVILFCLFGLLMIYETSNVMAFREFGDKYKFVKDQFLWCVIGFISLGIASVIPYKRYIKLSFFLLSSIIVSLILVFLPGIGLRVGGAHRWIVFGSSTFQPSEFTKLAVILYLSSWLTQKKVKFTHFFILLATIVGLIILQPDLGTAIILTGIMLALYFFSGAPFVHFLLLFPPLTIGTVLLAYFSPYRMQRVLTFLNPSADPFGASYHIRQILISLGSGGFWGLGLGASRQKYQFLPAATTDSIFAIIGEEFGFIGSIVLILGYLYLLYRIYRIVRRSSDQQSFLLSSGILALLGLQIVINLGATVVLFPLTGVPLPFISYGGSNLLISLLSIGIVLQISKHSSNNTQKRW